MSVKAFTLDEKLRILKCIWFIFCCLGIWIFVLDLYDVITKPELYPWGFSDDYWTYYASPKEYIPVVLKDIFWIFIGAILCLISYKKYHMNRWYLGHIFLAIMTLIINVIAKIIAFTFLI